MILAFIILYLLAALQSYWLAGNNWIMSLVWPFTLVFIFVLATANYFFGDSHE